MKENPPTPTTEVATSPKILLFTVESHRSGLLLVLSVPRPVPL